MIPPGKHGEDLAELVACRREREAAQAAVERVRALHVDSYGFCIECSGGLPRARRRSHPCPTIQLLGHAPTATDEEVPDAEGPTPEA